MHARNASTLTQALISVAIRSLEESKLDLGVNESKVVEVRYSTPGIIPLSPVNNTIFDEVVSLRSPFSIG